MSVIVGYLWVLAIIASMIAAIWTHDSRWALTGAVLAVVMVLPTLLAGKDEKDEGQESR